MKKILLVCCIMLALFSACSSDSENAEGSTKIDVSSIDSDYTYELPVIFHVLYQDENNTSQYIPYQRFANLIKYVNEIYEGGIYGESEDVNLKFVLATKDENGKTLRYPGVDYVHYTDEYPIDPSTFMNDNTGNNVKYIWDPNNYINVMMYNFKQSDDTQVVLGMSHIPYCISGHEIEGLTKTSHTTIQKSDLKFAYCSSINSLFANIGNPNNKGGYYQSNRYTKDNKTEGYTIEPRDIVVTMAHELGHYLGLFHVFTEHVVKGSTEAADSCGDTDYCTDTKSYNYFEYNEYLKSLMKDASQQNEITANDVLIRHYCDGTSSDYSEDIMDYSYTLGYKITPEQKERVRNVLYYSPLIPGPKKVNSTRAASVSTGPLDLKITTIK